MGFDINMIVDAKNTSRIKVYDIISQHINDYLFFVYVELQMMPEKMRWKKIWDR